ncbi:MAG: hypothetical protein ACHQX1_03345, partial [Candidatus Micrarchaeales archaeon]
PVYFAWDDKFNFYYISQPKSRHMNNTKKNSKSVLTIFSTNFSPDDDVFGVYVEGNAVIVPDDQVESAYNAYFKRRFPKTGKGDKPFTENQGEKAAGKFVKIIPTHMWYFDTRFFDEVRVEIPISALK